MSPQTFLSLVEEADARIIYSSPRGYVVETGACVRPTRRFAFRMDDMLETSAKDMLRVLRDGGPLQSMERMTRIVGYYSQIKNWNRSKIAELHDRHKGNYSVPEA